MAGAPQGNKNAVKERRMVTNALQRAAAQNPDKLRQACLAGLEKAAKGDLAWFKEIADRLDGKAAQSILLGEDQENPFNEVARRIVNGPDT